MTIDRDIEPSRPAPDRDAGRDRDPARHGHRRESDAKHPRRDFSDRVDGVVRDVAAFRVVALADLITQQYDGHPFAGRRGIGEAEQRGWIERQTAHGPKDGRFTVVVATPAGAARAAGLWAFLSGMPAKRTEGGSAAWLSAVAGAAAPRGTAFTTSPPDQRLVGRARSTSLLRGPAVVSHR